MCELFNYLATNILQVVAIIISVLALTITLVFNQRDYKHKRLSVKPLLSTIINSEGAKLRFEIINNGTGPAIIDKITFKYGSKQYENLKELLSKELKELNLNKNIKASISGISDYALAVRETKDLFEISVDEIGKQHKNTFIIFMDKWKPTIYYRDIYNKSFVLEADSEVLKKLI